MTTSSNTAPYGILYPPVAQSPTGDPSVSISSFYNQDRVSCVMYNQFHKFFSKSVSILIGLQANTSLAIEN